VVLSLRYLVRYKREKPHFSKFVCKTLTICFDRNGYRLQFFTDILKLALQMLIVGGDIGH
jgi:hypothetical protein